MSPGEPGNQPIRAAELVAALCLATDVGMGFPFEHGLQSTVIAMRLCERLGVRTETVTATFYTSLLAHSGCTTDALAAAEIFGAPLTTHLTPVMFGSSREQVRGMLRALPPAGSVAPARAMQIARRLPRAMRTHKPHLAAVCEVAQTLSEQLGLAVSIQRLFRDLTERWDGKGLLRRAERNEIPLPVRITHVAIDACLHRLLGGEAHAAEVMRGRAGKAFDPDVAACVIDDPGILAVDLDTSAWELTLAYEPQPVRTLDGDAIDRALLAMAAFSDLLSPAFSGHSVGVAELSATAGARGGLDPVETRALRRAALVHDLGRVAVGAAVWNKPGRLTVDEWEQVRLHPYHTERILSRSPFLSSLVPSAAAHHERLDRSGYHRGASGVELGLPARLLAAADSFHAMTEPRPYRPPLGRDEAARRLGQDAADGRLDGNAVGAVIEAAGQPAPPVARPAGLTEREAEVLRLLAQGRQTKQIGRALGISSKTADRHIQNIYGKIGVSTRPAATLFAVNCGLLAWGELPMGNSSDRP